MGGGHGIVRRLGGGPKRKDQVLPASGNRGTQKLRPRHQRHRRGMSGDHMTVYEGTPAMSETSVAETGTSRDGRRFRRGKKKPTTPREPQEKPGKKSPNQQNNLWRLTAALARPLSGLQLRFPGHAVKATRPRLQAVRRTRAERPCGGTASRPRRNKRITSQGDYLTPPRLVFHEGAASAQDQHLGEEGLYPY